MEIISVEASTFEEMMVRFESFDKRLETLCRQSGDKSMQEWLDNQEVCEILNISKRTLQGYRESGVLPYSKIGYKMFYRPVDVQKMFDRDIALKK